MTLMMSFVVDHIVILRDERQVLLNMNSVLDASSNKDKGMNYSRESRRVRKFEAPHMG